MNAHLTFWVTIISVTAGIATILGLNVGGVLGLIIRLWRKRTEQAQVGDGPAIELPPPRPRTFEQQLCPHCGKRGEKFSKTKRSDEIGFGGRHFCWYRCNACDDNWKVWID